MFCIHFTWVPDFPLVWDYTVMRNVGLSLCGWTHATEVGDDLFVYKE